MWIAAHTTRGISSFLARFVFRKATVLCNLKLWQRKGHLVIFASYSMMTSLPALTWCAWLRCAWNYTVVIHTVFVFQISRHPSPSDAKSYCYSNKHVCLLVVGIVTYCWIEVDTWTFTFGRFAYTRACILTCLFSCDQYYFASGFQEFRTL